jgi:hypothetical protein
MKKSRSIMLSLSEARRLAVASQGFGLRPSSPFVGSLRKLAARLHAFQIDSVNVLARAHYVPAFARLGPYPISALDSLAYTKRELFEYWGHAACLMPISLYPIVRYRMHRHTEWIQEYMRSERGDYRAKVYAEVDERGPLAAAEVSVPGKRSGNWWGWGSGKAALEQLYDAGLVAIAGRRGFERLYDLTERVIPQAALDAPAPPREEAMTQLICLGAKAYASGRLATSPATSILTGGMIECRQGHGRNVRRGAPNRLPNVSCRNWLKRDGCWRPMSTVGESLPISTPAPVRHGSSTPKHSFSLRPIATWASPPYIIFTLSGALPLER